MQQEVVSQASMRTERGSNMLVKWFLFHTKAGEVLLILLERWVGLAVVQADWLAVQCSGEPKAADKAQ